MTFDELKDWPLQSTRVSCADGKFGTLVRVVPGWSSAVVHIFGDPEDRVISAAALEPGDFETLVEMRSEG